ncbi:FAD-dependent oxidoreductase [Sulfurovum sp.]|uniref:NAD(P)/FAD-dependent oxidoreductase n=1 Tax=Sulfurovum sp. TaxID=1969726 RepID=UPI0025FA9147|nr:FAD-dependent oxidoreductase [Sulfurovum sp.]
MYQVIVIGGGYGGLRAIEHLYKSKDAEITLIDKNPYHYMQTESYGYIAGRFDITDVALDLEHWCRGFDERVKFICAKVRHIDFEKQTLVYEQKHIAYDELIIAVGARTHFFSFIQGLKAHSFGVKSLERSFGLRQAFEKRIYQKLTKEMIEREGDLHIVVGGAGLSGVEIAAEMAYMLKKYEKVLGSHVKEISITLIDASETILPGLDPYLIEKSQKRLESLGVNVRRGAFIEKVEERKIFFKEGEPVFYDFMIFTGGIEAAVLTKQIDVPKNSIGQFIVDERLHVGGKENVYAIGDCIELRDRSGSILPPTAQMAEKSAAYVAKEIKCKRERKENHQSFHATMDGLFVALGGNYAAGILYDRIKVSGILGFLLKKLVSRGYRLGLEIKVNAGYKKRIKR